LGTTVGVEAGGGVHSAHLHGVDFLDLGTTARAEHLAVVDLGGADVQGSIAVVAAETALVPNFVEGDLAGSAANTLAATCTARHVLTLSEGHDKFVDVGDKG
jgi:hypothetical protein